MEIIAEFLFQILGFVLRVVGELVIQLLAEAFGELFIHSVKEPFRRPEPIHPLLAAIGYALFGAAAGGLTVWLLPNFVMHAQWLRVLNLVVTPLIAGAAMGAIGAWRRRRYKEVIRLESFAYGYCFALSMGLVRFFFIE